MAYLGKFSAISTSYLCATLTCYGASAQTQASESSTISQTDPIMKLDVGTLSGIIGVVLTIIFFFIGYRQTIGAKKERAHAASREIVDALLRRLVLEAGFSIKLSGIEKLIAGKSLEHKVSAGDMLSAEEIEALLYSRVVESDYIPSDQRKPIVDRLEACFKGTQQETSFQIQPTARPSFRWSEIGLGVASALSSVIITAVFSSLTLSDFSKEAPFTQQYALIIVIIVLTTITAVAMVLFVRIREKTQTTSTPVIVTAAEKREASFHRYLGRKLLSYGLNYIQTPPTGPDFIIYLGDKKIGIEAVVDFSMSSASKLRSIFAKLRLQREGGVFDVGYIVTAYSVPEHVKKLARDDIQILRETDFLDMLSKQKSGESL